MTMLNDKGVKKLAYDLNLITPFNQANLQPNSYDLTLGNEYIRDKQFFIENQYLLQPNEFILELKKEINVVLTFNIIAKFLKTLSLNNDAWKIESLTSLLKLYDFKLENKSNKEIELESIIEQLTIYSRKLIK